ncbi:MAG: hypothetical protein V4557_11115 [Bacteroidota bacterium]
MKHFTLFLLVSLTAVCSHAQSSFLKNDLYLEAGGNGLFASANYERQLTKQPGLGIRFGVGFYSESAFYLTIPAGINYLFPLTNNQSFIDAGLGLTWTQFNGNVFSSPKNAIGESFVNFVPSVGYRKHTAKNLMWRISITPIVNEYGFVPWFGISIGKRF